MDIAKLQNYDDRDDDDVLSRAVHTDSIATNIAIV